MRAKINTYIVENMYNTQNIKVICITSEGI